MAVALIDAAPRLEGRSSVDVTPARPSAPTGRPRGRTVRPAGTRRPGTRGPRGRSRRCDRPGGVAAPSVRASVRRAARGGSAVAITDRGLLAALVVGALLVGAAVVAIVSSFLSVSNAPLDSHAQPAAAQVAAAGASLTGSAQLVGGRS